METCSKRSDEPKQKSKKNKDYSFKLFNKKCAFALKQ